jgi:hypothetical protein
MNAKTLSKIAPLIDKYVKERIANMDECTNCEGKGCCDCGGTGIEDSHVDDEMTGYDIIDGQSENGLEILNTLLNIVNEQIERNI